MYALSSKSGSEPFRFALFLGDFRWNDPISHNPGIRVDACSGVVANNQELERSKISVYMVLFLESQY